MSYWFVTLSEIVRAVQLSFALKCCVVLCRTAEVQQPPVLPEKEQQLPVVSVLQTVQDAVHIQVVEDLRQVHQVI